MHLIKLRFQHCALISQMDQHEKALETCKSTLPLLLEVIGGILEKIDSSKAKSSRIAVGSADRPLTSSDSKDIVIE